MSSQADQLEQVVEQQQSSRSSSRGEGKSKTESSFVYQAKVFNGAVGRSQDSNLALGLMRTSPPRPLTRSSKRRKARVDDGSTGKDVDEVEDDQVLDYQSPPLPLSQVFSNPLQLGWTTTILDDDYLLSISDEQRKSRRESKSKRDREIANKMWWRWTPSRGYVFGKEKDLNAYKRGPGIALAHVMPPKNMAFTSKPPLIPSSDTRLKIWLVILWIVAIGVVTALFNVGGEGFKRSRAGKKKKEKKKKVALSEASSSSNRGSEEGEEAGLTGIWESTDKAFDPESHPSEPPPSLKYYSLPFGLGFGYADGDIGFEIPQAMTKEGLESDRSDLSESRGTSMASSSAYLVNPSLAGGSRVRARANTLHNFCKAALAAAVSTAKMGAGSGADKSNGIYGRSRTGGWRLGGSGGKDPTKSPVGGNHASSSYFTEEESIDNLSTVPSRFGPFNAGTGAVDLGSPSGRGLNPRNPNGLKSKAKAWDPFDDEKTSVSASVSVPTSGKGDDFTLVDLALEEEELDSSSDYLSASASASVSGASSPVSLRSGLMTSTSASPYPLSSPQAPRHPTIEILRRQGRGEDVRIGSGTPQSRFDRNE
ncbi:hypothetical protein IE53DRAFT_359583 [Violaceomyces palustris]|uniref:Uncharacterized protein n=1 Tax=Violaceomyces palustris TaxID=1673888 RepID=A0ACD0P787_9BASI|nr:hypothetical protein IE53DRAFT_359583 [Violaceomyces palustris]